MSWLFHIQMFLCCDKDGMLANQSILQIKASSKHLDINKKCWGKKHYWSPDNECNTFISCRHSVSFLCFYSQESSCCSALPSLLRVCTTCCGLSPTFCSQHPYGAVKCKRDAGTLKNTPKQVYLSPSRWTKAYRLLLWRIQANSCITCMHSA